jgi:hypothetical protein
VEEGLGGEGQEEEENLETVRGVAIFWVGCFFGGVADEPG